MAHRRGVRLTRPPWVRNAIPTLVDGIVFPSKAEGRRWTELRLLERAGEITDLTRQPRFDCVVNDRKVCTYIGDFAYTRAGKVVIEDVKGYPRPTYFLKKRLVRALFDIQIEEPNRRRRR